jgi:hypothetical protein
MYERKIVDEFFKKTRGRQNAVGKLIVGIA